MDVERATERTDRSRRLRASTLLAALVLGLPRPANAVDIQYEVGGLARASDNITLADTNPTSDVLLSPRVSFVAAQQGSTLELSARGRVEYLYYVDDTLESKLRGEVIGELGWTVLPERIRFVVEDYLTRELVNAFDSRTSANEQLVNVLVLGPSFYARFNDVTKGQLDVRYAMGTAQESKDFESDRVGVAGRLMREISPNHRISGNLEATRVEYSTAQPAFDYSRRDAYVGYERNLAAVDIKLDAGYSWLSPRSGGTTLSGPLARANLDWRVAPRSLVAVVLAYQISDATQNLIARGSRLEGSVIGDLIDTNPDAILTPELFRTRRGDARYVFTDERLALAVRTYFERLRYVNVPQFDETSMGAVFDVEYKFRPRWTVAFQVGREDREFEASGRDDADLFLSVGVTNEITRHWLWRLELLRRQRDSSEPGRDYEENAAAFSLIYRR